MATQEANQAILQRLEAMPNFHPANAKLFDGWLLDPGDVVTVTADGTDYAVPVYQMKVDWKGESQVEITSTGSEKRPPLSELKRRNYGGGRTQAQVEKQKEELEEVKLRTEFTRTDEGIGMLASAVGVLIDTDESSPTYGKPKKDEHGNFIFDPNNPGSLNAKLDVTAEGISATVTEAQTQIGTLSGKLNVQAGYIDLVVTGTGEGEIPHVNAANIALEINKEGSGAYINADHIYIIGTTLLSGQVTVDDGALKVKTALLVSGTTNGNVSINNGTIAGKTHQVSRGGGVVFVGAQTGEHYDLTASIVSTMIVKAAIDTETNTLQLWKYGDTAQSPSITFRKAADITVEAPSAATIGADDVVTQTTVKAEAYNDDEEKVGEGSATLALTVGSYTTGSGSSAVTHPSVKVSLGSNLVAQINCDGIKNNGWNSGGATATLVTTTRGSQHVGALTPDSYVCAQYTNASGQPTKLSDVTWYVPASGGGSAVNDDVRLDNFAWHDSGNISDRHELQTLGNLIKQHKNDRGYIFLDGYILGGTGANRKYYITIGSAS